MHLSLCMNPRNPVPKKRKEKEKDTNEQYANNAPQTYIQVGPLLARNNAPLLPGLLKSVDEWS